MPTQTVIESNGQQQPGEPSIELIEDETADEPTAEELAEIEQGEPEQIDPALSEAQKIEILERAHRKRARIADLYDNLAHAEEAAKIAKDRVTAVKSLLDDAHKELCNIIDELKPAPADSLYHPDNKPGDESWWRDREIAGTLDLSPTIIDKLADAGLVTLGKLADYTAGDNQLVQIAGIGESAADKIEVALTKFWADNAPPKNPDPADEGDDEE